MQFTFSFEIKKNYETLKTKFKIYLKNNGRSISILNFIFFFFMFF